MISKHQLLPDTMQREWPKVNLIKEKMKAMDDKEIKFNLHVVSPSQKEIR